jgi:hypothetical protein
MCASLLLALVVFLTDQQGKVLGLVASYSFARQRHEGMRSAVDERLKATMSHKKQECAVRSLDGLAGRAQLSAADMRAYAMGNERLMQSDAFHGWRSKRHALLNVRRLQCASLAVTHLLPPSSASRWRGSPLWSAS